MSGETPLPPIALYVGRTTHSRLKPNPHRFSYGIFQLLVDVDHVEAGLKGLLWLRRGLT